MNDCAELQSRFCKGYIADCYGRLDESINTCKATEQNTLKQSIFDMLDRVKTLLNNADLKDETNSGTDRINNNTRRIPAVNSEYENTRRIARNTLAEANRHLDSGKIKNPEHHALLTRTAKDATDTLRNVDEMESRRRPYSGTDIGYSADMGRYSNARGDANEAMRSAMSAINKILPYISEDAMDDADDAGYEAEARRGVRGTGRGRRRVRVGGYTRRADTNNMDDMDYADESRSSADYDRRMNEAVARAAAEAASATARHMTANARGDIYPHTPVMPRYESYSNARGEYRNDARGEARMDARGESRSDDATSDRMQRPGPGGRE